jgi:hypothetical protein
MEFCRQRFAENNQTTAVRDGLLLCEATLIMNYFPKINRWRLPQDALTLSVEEMATDGRAGNEGTCFWFGKRIKGEADVSHLIFLRGSGVRKSPANVRVSAELMREVHERADSLGLTLLGQIHSHSKWCGVDMSSSDHAYGISVPYFLCVICPDFAQRSETTISECGVHVFVPKKGYVRLSDSQIERKMIITPKRQSQVSIVGEYL